jgi:hypothetical protein
MEVIRRPNARVPCFRGYLTAIGKFRKHLESMPGPPRLPCFRFDADNARVHKGFRESMAPDVGR